MSDAAVLTPSSMNTYRFGVRATDKAGNLGAYATGAGFKVLDYPETSLSIAYTGTWTAQSSTSFFGGSSRYASAAGAKATLTFSGARQIGWATSKNNNRGKAKVSLYSGTTLLHSATVDLYSASFEPRQLLYARSGLDPAKTYKLVVEVLGTKNASSTGTRADVDSFVVVR